MWCSCEYNSLIIWHLVNKVSWQLRSLGVLLLLFVLLCNWQVLHSTNFGGRHTQPDANIPDRIVNHNCTHWTKIISSKPTTQSTLEHINLISSLKWLLSLLESQSVCSLHKNHGVHHKWDKQVKVKFMWQTSKFQLSATSGFPLDFQHICLKYISNIVKEPASIGLAATQKFFLWCFSRKSIEWSEMSSNWNMTWVTRFACKNVQHNRKSNSQHTPTINPHGNMDKLKIFLQWLEPQIKLLMEIWHIGWCIWGWHVGREFVWNLFKFPRGSWVYFMSASCNHQLAKEMVQFLFTMKLAGRDQQGNFSFPIFTVWGNDIAWKSLYCIWHLHRSCGLSLQCMDILVSWSSAVWLTKFRWTILVKITMTVMTNLSQSNILFYESEGYVCTWIEHNINKEMFQSINYNMFDLVSTTVGHPWVNRRNTLGQQCRSINAHQITIFSFFSVPHNFSSVHDCPILMLCHFLLQLSQQRCQMKKRNNPIWNSTKLSRQEGSSWFWLLIWFVWSSAFSRLNFTRRNSQCSMFIYVQQSRVNMT